MSRVIDTYGTERSLVESIMLEFTEALGWKISVSVPQTQKGSVVGKDDVEGIMRMLRESAEQGDADAQCKLGYMYETGSGVLRDAAEAVKWYRKAAEQGDASGQVNLGLMYEHGTGVEKDAAEQGNSVAQNALKAIERWEGVSHYGTIRTR